MINDGRHYSSDATCLALGRTAASQAPPASTTYRLELDMDPATDRPFELHTNPILLDGTAVYHVLEDAALGANIINLTVAELEGAGDGQLSGSVTVDGVASERPVLAIARSSHALVGYTQSAGDGTFTLNTPGHTDEVYLLALNAPGDAWSANTALAVGDRVVPSTGHTGTVYEVTVGGDTGATEPTWWDWAEGNPSGVIGAATAIAVQLAKPEAQGPITPAPL
jgi:hypothetical protein